MNDVAVYKWSSYSEYVENVRIVDKAYALNMFSDQSDEAKGRFVQFLRETNSDVCLEIPEAKTNVDDDTLRQRVRQQIGIDAIAIGNEEREKQDHILRKLEGMDDTNIRQIARITGLSSTRVWKDWNKVPVFFVLFVFSKRVVERS